MNQTTDFTAEQFFSRRDSLPEGGRWVELVEGQVVVLEPPDMNHGTAVFNLSKALAEHLQQTVDENTGYFCFELGILVARDPDTVRFPAISYLAEGRRFEQTDSACADTPPRLVVEVASTRDRRKHLSDRVSAYHEHGVELVWIADPVEQHVHSAHRGQRVQTLGVRERLEGKSVLRAFSMSVEDVFAAPKWWK